MHAPNRIFLSRQTPPEKSFPKRIWVFLFMSSVPPVCSPLRLPRGEIVFYPTGRPSTLALTREIAALGYEVSGFPLRNTNLRLLIAPGVWHWTVVIGDIILFIVVPVESTDSASDQSGYETKDSPFYDSDNVDPDYPGGGWLLAAKVTPR